MIKEGAGHHIRTAYVTPSRSPTSFRNKFSRSASNPPPYSSGRISQVQPFTARQNAYRYFPSEGIYITCRGPWFSPSFHDRYSFGVTGVEWINQRHRSQNDRRGKALDLPGPIT